jgi:hypothetical protein
MTRTTKLELEQANTKLANENNDLRHQLSALRAELDALKGKPAPTLAQRAKAAVAQVTDRFIKGEKPIATFFNLKDAGEFIAQLKQRGCKFGMTARRNAHNAFTVWVKA